MTGRGLLTPPPRLLPPGAAHHNQRCRAQLASYIGRGCAAEWRRRSGSASRTSRQQRARSRSPPVLQPAAAAAGRDWHIGRFGRGGGRGAPDCQLWRRCVAAELWRPAPPAVALEGRRQRQAPAAPMLCQDVRSAGAARAGGGHATEHRRWRGCCPKQRPRPIICAAAAGPQPSPVSLPQPAHRWRALARAAAAASGAQQQQSLYPAAFPSPAAGQQRASRAGISSASLARSCAATQAGQLRA